ncbi:hypothetical protein RFI_01579 [Reticulomyxa filosa]|uniref:Uncharacterized protein n=1 Tax=Reticulomyxa filosa TaxID=46433 RepID=X6PBD6_RETFI|nr:hypothetical protein RFI_01579 [Reticulomyxa filosa]|eukprot:ETO35481.1 hypothetical protein RFI_01579 [Reticulomyxa filosa]
MLNRSKCSLAVQPTQTTIIKTFKVLKKNKFKTKFLIFKMGKDLLKQLWCYIEGSTFEVGASNITVFDHLFHPHFGFFRKSGHLVYHNDLVRNISGLAECPIATLSLFCNDTSIESTIRFPLVFVLCVLGKILFYKKKKKKKKGDPIKKYMAMVDCGSTAASGLFGTISIIEMADLIMKRLNEEQVVDEKPKAVPARYARSIPLLGYFMQSNVKKLVLFVSVLMVSACAQVIRMEWIYEIMLYWVLGVLPMAYICIKLYVVDKLWKSGDPVSDKKDQPILSTLDKPTAHVTSPLKITHIANQHLKVICRFAITCAIAQLLHAAATPWICSHTLRWYFWSPLHNMFLLTDAIFALFWWRAWAFLHVLMFGNDILIDTSTLATATKEKTL